MTITPHILSRTRAGGRRCVAALALLLAWPAAAWQDQAAPTTNPTEGAGEIGSLRPGSSPVLREGSLLVDALGTLEQDETTRVWRFRVDAAGEDTPDVTLTLLPCSVLHEMIELQHIAEDQAVAYELTGRVYVYRGHGFVLPTHAPQVADLDAPPAADDPPATDPGAEPAGDDDSVESIMRELETAVGPVVRAAGRGSSRVSDVAARLVPEGTMIVARRGRLTRTASGAWMFVFDADASGLGDPPMIVLPCLLLERMEAYTRAQGGEAAMMISGRVYAFGTRNYLIPSVFQIPRERSQLTP